MINPIKLSTITSISPLDGRYQDKLNDAAVILSELNFNLLRLTVEIEWLKTLAALPKLKEISPLKTADLKFLHQIIAEFDFKDIAKLKQFEKKTNHDLKAIEYFLKVKLAQRKNLKPYQEFIHFGCTSDDINNLSYALLVKQTRQELLLPTMDSIIKELSKIAITYAATPMLSRTHGQAASPTTFGKEMANFSYRLKRQIEHLKAAPILAKFNGAVGNFNAQSAAYPDINWPKLCRNFVEKFKLSWNPYTTQIEPHDWLAEHCDILARFNTILIALCRDLWGYIAIGYLKQKPVAREVGSSTMPHKINPIDFENAEGNLGVANALLNHFSAKLPISRWQRDLTDSTVMRNLGVAFSHSLLAYRSFIKGLGKIIVDVDRLKEDLNNHWEILSEAIQTMMRRYQVTAPYEKMKKLTRGQKIDQQTLHKLIKNLKIPQAAKANLLKLTPENYLGAGVLLAKEVDSISIQFK